MDAIRPTSYRHDASQGNYNSRRTKDKEDTYGQWLRQLAYEQLHITKNKHFSSQNFSVELPTKVADLARDFVKIKNIEELAKIWVAILIDAVNFDDDWSVGDLCRALLVVNFRLHGCTMEYTKDKTLPSPMRAQKKEAEETGGPEPTYEICMGPPPPKFLGNCAIVKTMCQLQPMQWFYVSKDDVTRQAMAKKISKVKEKMGWGNLTYYYGEDNNFVVIRQEPERKKPSI